MPWRGACRLDYLKSGATKECKLAAGVLESWAKSHSPAEQKSLKEHFQASSVSSEKSAASMLTKLLNDSKALRVVVKSAHGVKPADGNHLSDPYCKLAYGFCPGALTFVPRSSVRCFPALRR